MKLKTVFSIVLIVICSSCGISTTSAKQDNIVKEETLPLKDDGKTQQPDALQTLLNQIKNAASELRSCQTNLSYLFIQDPELLDSKTLRTGMLYYLKEEKKDILRIRFDDVKLDEFEPRKERQEYIFDGVWLERIDYKLEQIDIWQKAPEDKPVGVFELIGDNIPLIGFSEKESLSADFDITLANDPNESPETEHLFLKAKKDSRYKDYRNIEFWVDAKTYLPRRVLAYSTQGDIYDLQFLGMQANKKLKNAVFTIETPAHFRKNIERLRERPDKKGN